jgi:small subunit ribosomal protein S7
MARRKSAGYKRDIGLDPRFNSELVQKFINVVMCCGKKNIARRIVYDAIDMLVKKAGGDEQKGLETFHNGFEQVVPAVEVRPRRVGGSVYQIPVPVRAGRDRALAMRWLLKAASSRKDKSMSLRLAYEILDASEGRGAAVKRKVDMHKMAESNRAFSHYAW